MCIHLTKCQAIPLNHVEFNPKKVTRIVMYRKLLETRYNVRHNGTENISCKVASPIRKILTKKLKGYGIEICLSES